MKALIAKHQASSFGDEQPGNCCAADGESGAGEQDDAEAGEKSFGDGVTDCCACPSVQIFGKFHSCEFDFLRTNFVDLIGWQGKLCKPCIYVRDKGLQHHNSEDRDGQHPCYSSYGIVDSGGCSSVLAIDGLHYDSG